MSSPAETTPLRLERLAIDKRQRPTGARSGRGLLMGVAVVVLAGGLVAAWWYYRTTGRNIVEALAERPVDVPLMTVEVAASEAPETALVATGRIVSDRRVNVATKVSGQIVELDVEQGDSVEQGQVLARIEDVAYRAERDQAQATVARYTHELARAEAEAVRAEAAVRESSAKLEFEQRDYERLERLRKMEQASQQEFLDSRNRTEAAGATLEMSKAAVVSAKAFISSARSQLEAGEASLALFQKRLDDCAIRAPIAGVVLERNAEIGDFLAAEGGRGANANAQLVSIADMTLLRVEVDVSERDIARISKDQPARITPDASKGRSFDGRVLWVDPIGDYAKATVQVKVRILDPGPELRIEGSAKVEFLRPRATQPASGRSTPVVWLPKSAVKMPPNSDALVFTVIKDRAVANPVQVGSRSDVNVEILSGVYDGMQIVADGVEDLQDGTLVRVRAQ